jgi:hypothetical protein
MASNPRGLRQHGRRQAKTRQPPRRSGHGRRSACRRDHGRSAPAARRATRRCAPCGCSPAPRGMSRFTSERDGNPFSARPVGRAEEDARPGRAESSLARLANRLGGKSIHPVCKDEPSLVQGSRACYRAERTPGGLSSDAPSGRGETKGGLPMSVTDSGFAPEGAGHPRTEAQRQQADVAAELDRRRADRYRRYQERVRTGRLAEESERPRGVPAEGGTKYPDPADRRWQLGRLLLRT